MAQVTGNDTRLSLVRSVLLHFLLFFSLSHAYGQEFETPKPKQPGNLKDPFNPTGISYDDEWIRLIGGKSSYRLEEEEARRRLAKWRTLGAAAHAGAEDGRAEALEDLVQNMSFLVWSINDEVAFREIDRVERALFAGSPVDLYLQTIFLALTRIKGRDAFQIDFLLPPVGAAVRRQAQIREKENYYLHKALGDMTKTGRVSPGVRVQFFDRDTGEVEVVTADEWIERTIRVYSFNVVKEYAESSRVMYGRTTPIYIVFRYYLATRKEELSHQPVKPLPVPVPNAPQPTPVHPGHDPEKIGPPKVPVSVGPTPRTEMLDASSVRPVLDKCIACHVMDEKSHYVSSYATLRHTMRSGEYGTFQKKILPMMSNANSVHIHFNPDEIRTIAEVYRRTKEDENPGDPPNLGVPKISPQEARFPSNTMRAITLKQPVIVAGMMRCLVCHRDPNTEGAENVNTLSKLRAAMRTIDEDKVVEMIAKGYQHDRLIHIQDVPGFALETKLRQFANLPKDTPKK